MILFSPLGPRWIRCSKALSLCWLPVRATEHRQQPPEALKSPVFLGSWGYLAVSGASPGCAVLGLCRSPGRRFDRAEFCLPSIGTGPEERLPPPGCRDGAAGRPWSPWGGTCGRAERGFHPTPRSLARPRAPRWRGTTGVRRARDACACRGMLPGAQPLSIRSTSALGVKTPLPAAAGGLELVSVLWCPQKGLPRRRLFESPANVLSLSHALMPLYLFGVKFESVFPFWLFTQ